MAGHQSSRLDPPVVELCNLERIRSGPPSYPGRMDAQDRSGTTSRSRSSGQRTAGPPTSPPVSSMPRGPVSVEVDDAGGHCSSWLQKAG